MQGKLITFEGIDGVGKSTHIKFAKQVFEKYGVKIELFREPGSNKISEMIREILLNPDNVEISDETEGLLYLASRAQTVHDNILPTLESGTSVFCDRFCDSTIAYQGYGRGLDKQFLDEGCKYASLGVVPDKTILFTIPAEERARRLERREAFDRLESQHEDFTSKVNDGFLQIAKDNSSRVEVVDASSKHSVTAMKIIDTLSPIFNIEIDKDDIQDLLDEFDAAHHHTEKQ